jgi:hypothetical protein
LSFFLSINQLYELVSRENGLSHRSAAMGNHRAQFDEQLRLINAESREEAFHKAQELGKKR